MPVVREHFSVAPPVRRRSSIIPTVVVAVCIHEMVTTISSSSEVWRCKVCRWNSTIRITTSSFTSNLTIISGSKTTSTIPAETQKNFTVKLCRKDRNAITILYTIRKWKNFLDISWVSFYFSYQTTFF